MRLQTTTIRKYTGGGLGNLSDPGIPQAEVEVYLRSHDDETFYVSTLWEGILHLLSNQGYRLGVYVYPDGADFGRDCYAIVVWRFGNDLQVEIRAPQVDWSKGCQNPNTLWFAEEPKTLTPAQARQGITVQDLGELLGLAAQGTIDTSALFSEQEVTIDGS